MGKTLFIVLFVFTALLVTSCGGSSPSLTSPTSPSQGNTTGSLYIAASGQGQLVGFTVQQDQVKPISSSSPGGAPLIDRSIVDPAGQFVLQISGTSPPLQAQIFSIQSAGQFTAGPQTAFAGSIGGGATTKGLVAIADSDANVIRLYSVAQGALTNVASAANVSFPTDMAFNANGRDLYALTSAGLGISVFSVGSSTINLQQTVTFPAGVSGFANPANRLVLSPAGDKLIASGDMGQFYVLNANASDGTLSSSVSAVADNSANLEDIAVSPDSKHVYLLDISSRRIFGYGIASGSLTPLSGSPFPLSSTGSALAINDTGDRLYVYETPAQIESLSRDSSGGQLTNLAVTPISICCFPMSLTHVPLH